MSSSNFHLRPVDVDSSESPSPNPTSPPVNRHRRPLSPTSLRDVDLTHDADMSSRKYPAPPTGHDLMSFFPPAAPEIFPEMRPGTTSGFFQRQERAFFAQAGKEIVRVRVEVDLPQTDHDHRSHHHHHHPPHHPHPHSLDNNSPPGKSRSRDPGPSRPWSNSAHAGPPPAPTHAPPPPGAQPHLHLPPHAPTSPPQSSVPFHPSSRTQPQPQQPSRSGPVAPPVSIPTQPATGHYPPPQQQQQQPSVHPTIGLRTPPQDPSALSASTSSANPITTTTPIPPSAKPEYAPDDDDSWRTPMPYAERRRAGKHTRRVIRN